MAKLTGQQMDVCLSDLSDVDFSSLQDGHSIVYNNDKWTTGIGGRLILNSTPMSFSIRSPLKCWSTIYDKKLQQSNASGFLLKTIYETEQLNIGKCFIRKTHSKLVPNDQTLYFNVENVYNLVQYCFVPLNKDFEFDVFIDSDLNIMKRSYICGYF